MNAVREAEEDRIIVKMAGLAKQGAHMIWEVPERNFSHRDFINMPESRIAFLIKAVYDMLPTPHNKHVWYGEDERCSLCGEKGTLHHILSGCRVALCQCRYRWRHDKVLREIAQSVDEKRLQNNKALRKERAGISFVKAGHKKNGIL